MAILDAAELMAMNPEPPKERKYQLLFA